MFHLFMPSKFILIRECSGPIFLPPSPLPTHSLSSVNQPRADAPTLHNIAQYWTRLHNTALPNTALHNIGH